MSAISSDDDCTSTASGTGRDHAASAYDPDAYSLGIPNHCGLGLRLAGLLHRRMIKPGPPRLLLKPWSAEPAATAAAGGGGGKQGKKQGRVPAPRRTVQVADLGSHEKQHVRTFVKTRMEYRKNLSAWRSAKSGLIKTKRDTQKAAEREIVTT